MFFDKDINEIFKVGRVYTGVEIKTIAVAENEQIIGVVAKLNPKENLCYTDF